jgi:Domain of unknown function (DUF4920)
MKTFLIALALTASFAASFADAPAARQEPKNSPHTEADKHPSAAQGEQKDERASETKNDGKASESKAAGAVVRRGAALGDSPRVAFKDVLNDPQKFAGKTVIVEGVVERVCKAEGCWMQIAPEAGAGGSVRVTFDHKFSVPKDADKWKFRAEGVFGLKILSREEVEHLVKDDGAKIKTNPDGTANELSFVATGVELWK